MSTLARLELWARRVKRDVIAVWLASQDQRVPWHVKALAAVVVAYAVSPIDLIPDFIPVIGYLDDAVVVPLGILAVVKLIPEHVMAEHRAAATRMASLPASNAAAIAIVAIWIAAAAYTGLLVYRYAFP